MTTNNILDICKAGSQNWQRAFNQQDAAGCAAQYTEHSVMEARPFGVFKGREQIEQFWQGIIDQGFTDVDYSESEWEKSADEGYLLRSKWTMNKAFGLVHKEHWIVESDGQARLIYDEFEVLGDI